MRRAFLALLAGLPACVDVGGAWPNLSPAQQANRAEWSAVLRQHVYTVLTQAGMRLTLSDASAEENARNPAIYQMKVSLVVDRSGYVHLVKVDAASSANGLDAFVLAKLTEAGPVPPPPASLVAFNNRLQMQVTLNERRRPAATQT
jgi:hypothetical protein